MVAIATFVTLLAATMLMVEQPSGGDWENNSDLQVRQISAENARGVRGVFDCDNFDKNRGTCWYNDWKHRDSRFQSDCGGKGNRYSFKPIPLLGGKCYCFKCQ